MSWRLYVDLGNGAIKFGVPAENGWEHVERHELGSFMQEIEITKAASPDDVFARIVQNMLPTVQGLASRATELEAVVVVSSNPEMDRILQMLVSELKAPLRRLGKDFKHKIKSRYNLVQLGPDRLANIVAALDSYAPPVVIVDAGVCTKIDVLDAQGLHRGGILQPGRPALVAGLALVASHLQEALGKVRLPQDIIGVNTVEALTGGMVMTCAGQVNFALQSIERVLDLDGSAPILCGGGARELQITLGGRLDEWLTLDGLRLADETVYPPS